MCVLFKKGWLSVKDHAEEADLKHRGRPLAHGSVRAGTDRPAAAVP
jgi:hypothetical protein